MKIKLFPFIILLAISLSSYGQSHNWTSYSPVTSGNIFDIEITKDSTIWVSYGSPPFVYKSNNYGINWTSINQILPVSAILSVYFLNDSIGFIGGSKPDSTANGTSTIWYTRDYGQSWTESTISINGEAVNKIEFADSLTGYAIEGQSMLVTNDGGLTWTPYNSPISSSNLFTSIYVLGRDNILKGADSLFLKTNNGPWTAVFPDRVFDIDFISDSIGFAISQRIVLKTIDMGNNWDTLSSHNIGGSVKAINAFSELDIFIGGGRNQVYRAYNGGIYWSFDFGSIIQYSILNLHQFQNDLWLTGTHGQLYKRNSSIVNNKKNNNRSSEVSIFPNPTMSSILLDNLELAEIERIQVLDITGKLVKEIFVSDDLIKYEFEVPPGLYFFKLINRSGKQEVIKIIKH